MGATKLIGFRSGYPAKAALAALDLIAGQPRRYWLCYPLRQNAFLGSNGGASMRRATPPGTLGALTKTACPQEISDVFGQPDRLQGGLRALPARADPQIAGGQQTRSSSFCAGRMKRPFISELEVVPDEPIIGGERACASVLSVTLLNSVEPCEAFVVADQAPRSARYRSPAVIPQRFGAILFP